ncbi:MAG: DinB family protein [Pyrinomonadaceae bacterium]
MESLDHLKRLFRFNDWANRIVLRTLRETDSEEALLTFAHVLVTEREYYERLYGKDSTGFDFHPKLTIEECASLALENAGLFETLLGGFDEEGLGQSASYRTSEGVPSRNTYREMLSHVLFHSMAHRGQILSSIRRSGNRPPSIDYIIFERETGG